MNQTSVVIAAIFQLGRIPYRNVDPASFDPDRRETATIAELSESNPAFRFNGPGWYEFAEYTWLLVPAMYYCGEEAPERFVVSPMITANPERQRWTLFVFPPTGSSGRNDAMDALVYLAALQRCQPKGVDIDPLDEVEPEPAQPLVVTLPPGGHVRVELFEADGGFDITFGQDGSQRVIVTADMPGNVMGQMGPIYVEDGERDTDGTMRLKTEIVVAPPYDGSHRASEGADGPPSSDKPGRHLDSPGAKAGGALTKRRK